MPIEIALADSNALMLSALAEIAEFHLRNLYDKLAVSNRTQAIAFYYHSAASRYAELDT